MKKGESTSARMQGLVHARRARNNQNFCKNNKILTFEYSTEIQSATSCKRKSREPWGEHDEGNYEGLEWLWRWLGKALKAEKQLKRT